MVGASGFEPPTSWSRTRRSSQAEPRPEKRDRGFGQGPLPPTDNIIYSSEQLCHRIVLGLELGQRGREDAVVEAQRLQRCQAA